MENNANAILKWPMLILQNTRVGERLGEPFVVLKNDFNARLVTLEMRVSFMIQTFLSQTQHLSSLEHGS